MAGRVFTIDTDDLGTGPVTFRAMARGTKGKASHVFAAPVTVQIDPLR